MSQRIRRVQRDRTIVARKCRIRTSELIQHGPPIAQGVGVGRIEGNRLVIVRECRLQASQSVQRICSLVVGLRSIRRPLDDDPVELNRLFQLALLLQTLGLLENLIGRLVGRVSISVPDRRR